jgi:hypothetical protein
VSDNEPEETTRAFFCSRTGPFGLFRIPMARDETDCLTIRQVSIGLLGRENRAYPAHDQYTFPRTRFLRRAKAP